MKRIFIMIISIVLLFSIIHAEEQNDYMKFAYQSFAQGDYAIAKDLVNKHLTLQPNDVKARILLANIYTKQRNLEQTLIVLTEAAKLSPNNVEIQNQLTECRLKSDIAKNHFGAAEKYKELKNFKAAKSLYEKAAALDVKYDPTLEEFKSYADFEITKGYKASSRSSTSSSSNAPKPSSTNLGTSAEPETPKDESGREYISDEEGVRGDVVVPKDETSEEWTD